VNLSCHFYAEEPREAFRLRSDCYFEIMETLRDRDIAFAGVAA
jgi:hypothetical protein